MWSSSTAGSTRPSFLHSTHSGCSLKCWRRMRCNCLPVIRFAILESTTPPSGPNGGRGASCWGRMVPTIYPCAGRASRCLHGATAHCRVSLVAGFASGCRVRAAGRNGQGGGFGGTRQTGKTKRPQRFHGGAFKSYARTDPSAYLPAASAINRLRCALQNFAGRLAHFRCQCHRRGHYNSYSLLRNLFLIDHRARSTDSSISLSTSFPASPAGGRRLPFPPHARQMLPRVGRLAFGISSRPRPLQA